MATNSGRPAPGSQARPYVPPVRQNTRLIGAHFPPDVVKEFKFMVVELESTGQALVTEAIEDLFKKYGKRITISGAHSRGKHDQID